MSFISLEAPRLAKGFPDAKPPKMMLIEESTNRYITTIRSPKKLLAGSILFNHNIVDTSITLERPIIGAIRNVVFETPFGIRVSFPRSFTISINGCSRGGPTRYCTLAVTFLSIQLARSPIIAVSRNPKTIRYNTYII